MAGLMLTFSANPEHVGKAMETAAAALENQEKTLGKTLGKTPISVLEFLRQSPSLTVPEIAVKLAKSESAVQRAILKLQQAGALKRIGSRKSGHWEVAL